MDTQTLLASLDFTRQRLLGVLDTIEKSGRDMNHILAWRPAPGRAHIGWQAMHCAATHDRYLHQGVLQQPVSDEALVANYAGGTTPSDQVVPTLPQIRAALAAQYETFRAYVAKLTPADLAQMKPGPGGKPRSLG